MVSLLKIVILTSIMIALGTLTEINRTVLVVGWLLALVALGSVDYYYNMHRKPLLHTKAKVKLKWYSSTLSFLSHKHRISFVLANKNVIDLRVSRKQYNAVDEHDIVEIKYQGWLLRSLRRAKNENEIVNEDYSWRKVKKK